MSIRFFLFIFQHFQKQLCLIVDAQCSQDSGIFWLLRCRLLFRSLKQIIKNLILICTHFSAFATSAAASTTTASAAAAATAATWERWLILKILMFFTLKKFKKIKILLKIIF